MRPLLAALAAVLLAGCGAPERTERPPAPDRAATATGAGPLTGPATQALECDGRPYRKGSGDYDDGLATVQDHPETALVNYLGETLGSDELPDAGYRVERRDAGRALLSYDVGGRTKVAFIAADGMRDFEGSRGWGIETWAQCDLAEMPAAFTEAAGTGVWEDARGRRVPVSRVRSFRGSEHCDWQDVTYLAVRVDGRERWFLRDTAGGDFDGLLRTTFDPSSSLPPGATDTGYRRDGRVLWVADDAAYLVAAGDAHDVERWPAPKRREPPLCS